ncbi:restriction endonuclease subunit S [Mucilaginibacter gotjawali]|uniref:Type I restriction enzyme S subunit n=2 Tax=Mucilaginibacter gotjawali TaxID=1550579 RepID=A0A839SB16_9SPHI|nr:restriction endonuclease subunit S [Mucilaginibacter gotjawali]MBB3055285.1 type I restriction enzyme S subunit [Mucilaginibacter gotjawali]BAU56096.1 putative type-1 restriction enzyme specificity protein MPN_089 [Mucilaginibacter gotjawali]
MQTQEKLGAKCLVGDGAHASIKRVDIGIPYLSSKNFKQAGIDLSSVSFISNNDYEKHFKVSSKALTRPQPNDLIFSIIGSIGAPYLISENDKFGISSSVAIIRPKEEVDPKFLFYYLKTDAVQNYVEAIKSGSAQGFLSLEMIRSIPLQYPRKSAQEKIASLLGTYDELMEVNDQRITVLEETARELYKEWFVRMRFPGYKMAKFEKGIPKGWEMKKIVNAFEVIGGGTPSTEKDEYWGGNINWFTPTDITGSDGIFLNEAKNCVSERGLKESSAKLFPAYSIMMTSRATIGAVGINSSIGCTNQGFITCIPNDELPYIFLYFWILFNKETFEMMASGSTFLEITKGTFKKVNILVPEKEIVKQYHNLAEPIFKQIENLQQQNTQLRQIRDRLLPRLISGKLKVKTEREELVCP